MNTLEQTVRSRFPDLVLLGCLLGFLGLIFELNSVQHYREGTQIIGFVCTIIGAVAAALGFVRGLRPLVLGVLALLAVAGLYGLNEHREVRAEDYAKWQARQSSASSSTATTPAPAEGTAGESAGTEGAGGEAGEAGGPPEMNTFRSNIPVLAPASLSGLSALAFLAVLARRRPDEVVTTVSTTQTRRV